MADLPGLRDFAASQGLDLTAPLSHAEVVSLAEHWLPEVRFFEDERFHPISLDAVIGMVEDHFGQLEQLGAEDDWRVEALVRADGSSLAEIGVFDPPVVHVPDGTANIGLVGLPVVRVLSDETSAREALGHPDVDGDAVITHGASFRRSMQFFGATESLSGAPQANAGDPFVPRAVVVIDDQEEPLITVLAAYKNLFELLEYELAVEADDDYPPDALRGGFDIAPSLFRQVTAAFLIPEVRRQVLGDLVTAHRTGSPLSDALPPGWVLDEKAWDALTRYAFLEYYFVYAYNDWERYQLTPFDNEHEGDDESCCLVFDRNVINVAAAAGDPELLLSAVPHAIITSVHEENQDADRFALIPTPLPDPDQLPRLDIDLVVYPAGGSHATYLTPGDHDLVDFGDAYTIVSNGLWFLGPIGSLLGVVAGILTSIIDHFVDTEDYTSDDGIRTGPSDVVGDHPRAVAHAVEVLPMSGDNHIYQAQNADLLRLRAYPGKWGGHDGFIDKSPRFEAKTGRYFRKLLRSL